MDNAPSSTNSADKSPTTFGLGCSLLPLAALAAPRLPLDGLGCSWLALAALGCNGPSTDPLYANYIPTISQLYPNHMSQLYPNSVFIIIPVNPYNKRIRVLFLFYSQDITCVKKKDETNTTGSRILYEKRIHNLG